MSDSQREPAKSPQLSAAAWRNYQVVQARHRANLERHTFPHLVKQAVARRPIRTFALSEGEREAMRNSSGARARPEATPPHRNGRAEAAVQTYFLSRPLGIDRQWLFFQAGNYALALPHPETFWQSPGDYYKGVGSTQIEAYADNVSGEISLGFVGGDFRYGTGSIFMKSPMTQTFPGLLPLDGISTSASLFAVAKVPANHWNVASAGISVGLSCPVRNSDPNNVNQSVNGLYALDPGLASSALSGLVTATGFLNVTATTLSQGAVVSSNSSTTILLSRMMTQGPGSFESNVQLVQDDCVFIEPSLQDQTIEALSNITLDGPADTLVVEAEVRLIGARGGIGDPGAGFIGAKLQSVPDPNVSQVDIGAYGYSCPFQVAWMGAFI
jgi:hypothetical protein